MDCYIDCMVSLDCGSVLGTYQGQVDSIDPLLNTITLKNTFRNGVPYRLPCITIRSQDILNLEIVKSSQEAQNSSPIPVSKPVVPSSSLCELISNSPSPPNNQTYSIKSIDDRKNNTRAIQKNSTSELQNNINEFKDLKIRKHILEPSIDPVLKRQDYDVHCAPIDGLKNEKFDQLMQRLHDSFDKLTTGQLKNNGMVTNVNNKHYVNNKPRSVTPPVLSDLFANASRYGPISLNDNDCYQSLDENCFSLNGYLDDGRHFNNHINKKYSGSWQNTKFSNDAEFYMRKRTASETYSPRRGFPIKNPHIEDCFSTEYDMNEEFDFEMNLAMFDKDQVYKEIERKKKKVPTATLR